MNKQPRLPIPQVLIPEYKLGTYGAWQITTVPVPKNARGYFNGLPETTMQETTVLSEVRPQSNTPFVWMSFTAMEQESHCLHVLSATGDVVVCGLGLGMYLYNILRKPCVTSVTVIERNPFVINLFKTVSNYQEWEGVEKLTILEDDALNPVEPTTLALTAPDFLYVDIWEVAGAETAQSDTRKVCEWLKPISAGWWTQETDIITFYASKGIPAPMILDPMLSAAAEKLFRTTTGIPTLGTETCTTHALPHYGKYVHGFGMELLQQTALGNLS